jgi:hypothetical protein
MFLSGTILRQIAQPTPALTRPTRRPVLEKMRLQLVMAGFRLDQEASRSAPAVHLQNRRDTNQAGHPLVPRARLAPFPGAHSPAIHSLATCFPATVTPRAARAAVLAIEPAGPVRGRRDGLTPAWDHAHGPGSGQASGSSVTAHRAGLPGSRRAAHQMPCDLSVTARQLPEDAPNVMLTHARYQSLARRSCSFEATPP